ncbi:hypothetical protein [Actinokineospora globicatena]|uniref:DUF1449 family protein n=1 Tax=Actinokineospora globicatena TaxID=103729 RepID=A0A9W6QMI7_9PSEU|nr:hypothetical protein [Actinokineospora globicatena]GLW92430.1 hypothetical protein Aglo03_32460 [Actinokineospora globicatena]
MDRLLLAAFSFPAVVFTFLIVVVAGYWLLVALGVSTVEAVGAADPEAFGLGRVPLSVALSMVTVLAWGVSMLGDVVLTTAEPSPLFPGVLILVVALAAALMGTRFAIPVLNKLLPVRLDLVGTDCVVRTGRVDRSFGAAEVTTVDGRTVLVQVRQSGDRPLRTGARARIQEYDRRGGFFWITA